MTERYNGRVNQYEAQGSKETQKGNRSTSITTLSEPQSQKTMSSKQLGEFCSDNHKMEALSSQKCRQASTGHSSHKTAPISKNLLFLFLFSPSLLPPNSQTYTNSASCCQL